MLEWDYVLIGVGLWVGWGGIMQHGHNGIKGWLQWDYALVPMGLGSTGCSGIKGGLGWN